MKFNIDDYKGKYVMHCKTEEEAKDFCEYLDSIGRCWCTGASYKENTAYHCYKNVIAYDFNKGCYSDVKYYRKHNYTILEWSDFMNKEFTKADLKTGDLILRKSGDVEIVIKELNVLLSPKGSNPLTNFRNDLTHDFLDGEDIIAVRRPQYHYDCQFSAFKEERGTLVYERKEVEEMTLAEVCRLLGKEIKIVK